MLWPESKPIFSVRFKNAFDGRESHSICSRAAYVTSVAQPILGGAENKSELKAVPLENFPNKIRFAKLFDCRLKDFGIDTEVDGPTGKLIAPDGTVTVVQKTAGGGSSFAGKMPLLVRNAIAQEFKVDLYPIIQRTHVVIEGRGRDPQLISALLGAATECDQLLGAHLEHNYEFLDLAPRLANYELAYSVDFSLTVLELVRRALNQGAFCFHLHKSFFGHEFAVMVDIGFFVRVGDHYQMAIPPKPTIQVITNALMQVLETEDARYFLHPERYLVTMSKFEAKSLCKGLRKRLREKGETVELTPAGRETLASAFSVENGATNKLG
jgi:hypothetical protein